MTVLFLPTMTPILQLKLLWAHDISVPVESFRMAITAIEMSCSRISGEFGKDQNLIRA